MIIQKGGMTMEKMQGEYLMLVNKCIFFARKFMELPEHIDIFFEECPSEIFPTMNNAAEGGENRIVFNKLWFVGADRWNNHKDDIEFFVFHELRHLHQHYEINRLANGLPLHEKQDTVEIWKDGFLNYQRNEGGASQDVNIAQEVEIDANAYAQCLSNFFHLHYACELHFSVPLKAMELANIRSRIYYQSLPEFVEFINIEKIKQKENPVQRRTEHKPERNAPCPCGSGKKFKMCCIGKGIYD